MPVQLMLDPQSQQSSESQVTYLRVQRASQGSCPPPSRRRPVLQDLPESPGPHELGSFAAPRTRPRDLGLHSFDMILIGCVSLVHRSLWAATSRVQCYGVGLISGFSGCPPADRPRRRNSNHAGSAARGIGPVRASDRSGSWNTVRLATRAPARLQFVFMRP